MGHIRLVTNSEVHDPGESRVRDHAEPSQATMLRSLFFVSALVAAAALSGCSSEVQAEDTASADSNLTSTKLESLSIIRGTMKTGASLTVAYEPELYGELDHLPFIAVELLPAKASATPGIAPRTAAPGSQLTVRVAGKFPGKPRLLVVDGDFKLIGGSRGLQSGAGTAAAQVTITNSPGAKFVLVRDEGWVAPMQFEIETMEQ